MRQGRNGLKGTNALAYFGSSAVTKKESFLRLAPDELLLDGQHGGRVLDAILEDPVSRPVAEETFGNFIVSFGHRFDPNN